MAETGHSSPVSGEGRANPYQQGLDAAEAALRARQALSPDELAARRVEDSLDSRRAASGDHLKVDLPGEEPGDEIDTILADEPVELGVVAEPEPEPEVEIALDDTVEAPLSYASSLPVPTLPSHTITAAWRMAMQSGDWSNVDDLMERWNKSHPGEELLNREEIFAEQYERFGDIRAYYAEGVDGELVAVANDEGDIVPPEVMRMSDHSKPPADDDYTQPIDDDLYDEHGFGPRRRAS